MIEEMTFPTCASICLFTPLLALAADWPQWRGPNSSGVSTESSIPVEWSNEKNVAWKTALPGRGSSQPVIVGKYVFLTAEIAGGDAPADHKAPVHHFSGQVFVHPDSVGVNKLHKLVVLALDRDSGKILWQQTAYDGVVFDNRHKKGSYASPTPIADGKNVYAYFGNEGLYAYDLKGKLLWFYMPAKFKTTGLGPGTSPTLEGNLIFLQCDDGGGEGSYLVALDKNTGKETWKAAREKIAFTWATPVVAEANGRKELITAAGDVVIAYDPGTGKELWRGPGVKGYAVTTPVLGHGMAFFAAGYPTKYTYAVKLGGSGEMKPVWSYEKGTAYVPSPILYGDYYYVMSDKGLLTCFDAKTGVVKYEGKRPTKPATFMGSPVAADGKILITSEDGDTTVIKAGAEFEILTTNSIGEPVYSSAAIADGHIYLRGEKHLYSIKR